MAEILLSLTIIGVVAAITLPSLTGNINERTWNTQRKALYSRMSQAISLMPALNGYGTLVEDADGNVIADTAAETFVTNGLSRVLKMNNICDNEHLADCGIPTKFVDIAGRTHSSFPATLWDFNPRFNYSGSDVNGAFSYSQINTKAAAFETVNGESIVVFYNPSCAVNMIADWTHVGPMMCANFVYDLNGTKGPNTVGKDMGFMTAIYPTDTRLVTPIPTLRNSSIQNNDSTSVTYNEAGRMCKKVDDNSRLPDIYEMMSIYYNRELLGNIMTSLWSSTRSDRGGAYALYTVRGTIQNLTKNAKTYVRCVKR